MLEDYLRMKGVDNVIYAYSTGNHPAFNESKYLERYPGDDMIDLLGFDCYQYSKDGKDYVDQLDKLLSILTRIGKEHHNRIAGYTWCRLVDSKIKTGYWQVSYQLCADVEKCLE